MGDEIKIYNNIRFANRIDTPQQWTSKNPILENGEIGFINNSGTMYLVVGDERKNSMGDIALSLENNTHEYDGQVFYAGPMGGIPIASSTQLGGVKIDNPFNCGLVIHKESGYLRNALINGYDYNRKCFIVSKLYIKELITDKEGSNVKITGDTILLRDEQTEPLKNYSGITVNSLSKYQKMGFLGIDNRNTLVIKEKDTYITCRPIVGLESGYVQVGSNKYKEPNPYANIVPFSALNVVDGTKVVEIEGKEQVVPNIIEYTPDKTTTIDITPPAIVVNSQKAEYDKITRQYTIELDGGLTPENSEKLNNLGALYDRVNTLESDVITTINSGPRIQVSNKVNNELTITHESIECTNQVPSTPNIYYIETDPSVKQEVLTFLADIETDSFGHVIKKIYNKVIIKVR